VVEVFHEEGLRVCFLFQFIEVLLYKSANSVSRLLHEFQQKMHFSRYALDVLLRITSKERVVAVSLEICVVGVRPDFEGAKEGGHAPQFVVGHSVLPLSPVVLVYPRLSAADHALGRVHSQQVMLRLIDRHKFGNVALLKY
jgi:hypothetical protein